MKAVQIRTKFKAKYGLTLTASQIRSAAQALEFGDRTDFSQEECNRIIDLLAAEMGCGTATAATAEQLPQHSPDRAESGAITVLDRIAAPLNRIDATFDGIEQAYTDKYVNRVRRLIPNVMTRIEAELAGDDIGVEIIEMTFTALMPAPSVVQLKPAEPKALIAG